MERWANSLNQKKEYYKEPEAFSKWSKLDAVTSNETNNINSSSILQPDDVVMKNIVIFICIFMKDEGEGLLI